LPDLEQVHTDLKTTQRKGTETSTKMAALGERTVALDAQHDRLTRGLFDLLGGLAGVAETDEEAQSFLLARDELMPHGMLTIGLSYQDEAGNAATTEDRLSPASRKLLQHVKIGGKPLSATVERWRTVARDLGQADDERTALKGKGSDGPTPADALAARNGFIRAVGAVRAMAGLESTLGEDEQQRIFGYLDDAEARASKRGRGKGAGEPAAEAPAPDAKAEAAPDANAEAAKAKPAEAAPAAPAKADA
jgi:hypothetical protein